jgi:hypothetical protein
MTMDTLRSTSQSRRYTGCGPGLPAASAYPLDSSGGVPPGGDATNTASGPVITRTSDESTKITIAGSSTSQCGRPVLRKDLFVVLRWLLPPANDMVALSKQATRPQARHSPLMLLRE